MSRPKVVLTDPINPDAHALLNSHADIVVLPDGVLNEAAWREAMTGAQVRR
jgi:hypothetical protein